MSNTRQKLLRHMADMQFHSGESLGQALGLSRAAVWKQIQALQADGLVCEAVHGKGYRLAVPVEPLDPQVIQSALPQVCADSVDLIVLDETESTNGYLLARAVRRPQHAQVCLAEHQTAGRGRRGRQWQSPYGTSLALSLLWRFDAGAAALAGLSLATGVAVAECLEQAGAAGLQLKWPNDLVYGDRKLGGILLEVTGDAAGPCYVVIGIGLNIATGSGHAGMRVVEQPWVNLAELLPDGRLPSRNRLAAGIIAALMEMLPEFEARGFGPLADAFRHRDALYEREVWLERGNDRLRGRAMGVADNGGLILEHGGRREIVFSGEVSVRTVEG
jgi:BirA family biotin operon repressor/biotin-[acetyl-CoA-carboxylase] ligase